MSFPTQELADLGYDVQEADADAGIYRVEGFGMVAYLSEAAEGTPAEEDALATLLDPAAHAERVFLFEHPGIREAVEALEERGVTTDVDTAAGVVHVTKPGDPLPSSMTFDEFRVWVGGLEDLLARRRRARYDALVAKINATNLPAAVKEILLDLADLKLRIRD